MGGTEKSDLLLHLEPALFLLYSIRFFLGGLFVVPLGVGARAIWKAIPYPLLRND